MKLEKFLEKDIREWLDEVADRTAKRETPGLMREEEIDVFDFTKDYSKEVRIALDKGDLEQARNIFLQLRKEYGTFNKGSQNQKKAYRMLWELRAQIKTYLEELPESVITPREPEKLGILMPPNPDKPQYDIPADELERLEKERDEVAADIRDKIQQLEDHLKENEVVEAVEIYRDVKSEFLQVPEIFKDTRKELYDELLTAYYQIRKAAERLERYEEEFHKEFGGEPKELDQDVELDVESDVQPEAEIEAEPEEGQASKPEFLQEPETEPEQIPEQQTPEQQDTQEESIQKPAESIAEEAPPPPPPHLRQGEEDEMTEEEPEEIQDDTKTKEEILAKLDEARNFIKKKNAKKAFNAYKEAKHLFRDFEAKKEVKEEIFKDLLGIYHSLTELENHLIENSQRPRPQESVIKQEEPDLIEKINKAKIKAYKYLDNEEVESAITQYDKLRELFDQIPEEMEDEKSRLHKELMGLHDDIVNAKQQGLLEKEEITSEQAVEEIESITQHIKEGDIESAKKEFLELQHKTLEIKDEDKRRELYRALDSIKNKLSMMESTKNMDRMVVEV